MINTRDILETITMIQEENLDIRTITMGISLLDCCDSDIQKACGRIYEKITRRAERLVRTGEENEREFGIPIINKRISVTPIAMIGIPSSRSICSPVATSFSARRVILSYTLSASTWMSLLARSRSEMPIVIVRMSRCCLLTMASVSAISAGVICMMPRLSLK